MTGIDIYFANLAAAEAETAERERVDALKTVRHDVERMDRNVSEAIESLLAAAEGIIERWTAGEALKTELATIREVAAQAERYFIMPEIEYLTADVDALIGEA